MADALETRNTVVTVTEDVTEGVTRAGTEAKIDAGTDPGSAGNNFLEGFSFRPFYVHLAILF